MDDEQLDRFGEVVEEKKARSKAASQDAEAARGSGSDVSGDQPGLTSAERPQDTRSVRAKNAGKGKKTADKWNQ
jgi:hypothetical protein